MMIKFIEILTSWARPWKLFHYAYGADQDLICIMGTGHVLSLLIGSRMSTAIFGVRMRDPNKMQWPRSVRELELGVLTWDVQDCLEEISWCWCVTCTEYGSRLSPINTPWIFQLKRPLVSHSPVLLLINDLGWQTSHNLINRKISLR